MQSELVVLLYMLAVAECLLLLIVLAPSRNNKSLRRGSDVSSPFSCDSDQLFLERVASAGSGGKTPRRRRRRYSGTRARSQMSI